MSAAATSSKEAKINHELSKKHGVYSSIVDDDPEWLPSIYRRVRVLGNGKLEISDFYIEGERVDQNTYDEYIKTKISRGDS